MKLNLVILAGLATFGFLSFVNASESRSEPTTREKVAAELQALVAQDAGSSVEVGQFAKFNVELQDVGSDSRLLFSQMGLTVLGITEGASSVDVQLFAELVTFSNGTEISRDQSNESWDIPKHGPVSIVDIPAGDYSNLKAEDVLFPTPESVLNNANCGGLEGCPKELKARKVSYNFRDNNGKERFLETWSCNEVPFYAHQLKHCETDSVGTPDAPQYWAICRTVVDFKKSN